MSEDEFIPELEKRFQEEKSKLDKAHDVSDFKNILFRLLEGKYKLSIAIMDLNLRVEDTQETLENVEIRLSAIETRIGL